MAFRANVAVVRLYRRKIQRIWLFEYVAHAEVFARRKRKRFKKSKYKVIPLPTAKREVT